MRKSSSDFGLGCFLSASVLALASIGGWLTHVIYCLSNQMWGFLIAGAIAAPIGVIHGWMIWLGLAG